MHNIVKLGTRGSPLALAQAEMVAQALVAAHGWPADTVKIIPIITTGDRVQDRPLAEIGGKALWTKELDSALHDHRIDFAVHSMKDVETSLAEGIALSAMLPRADVRDRLIGARRIDLLRHGAIIGTSSPRRTAQLLALRSDLRVVMLRGNVATRMAKVGAGEVDATLLAAAGLDRLQLAVGRPIALKSMLPAAAQGAIGTTARSDDAQTLAWLAAIDDAPTSTAVRLERRLLAALGADCHSPVAALAVVVGNRITFRAQLLAADGSETVQGRFSTSTAKADAQVDVLAARLLAAASPALRRCFGV